MKIPATTSSSSGLSCRRGKVGGARRTRAQIENTQGRQVREERQASEEKMSVEPKMLSGITHDARNRDVVSITHYGLDFLVNRLGESFGELEHM
jgi:hypothetical protein